MYKNLILRMMPPEPGLTHYTNDKSLSLKAKGLIAVIIDDYILEETHKPQLCWTLTRATRHCCESKATFTRCMQELKECGYFDRIGKKIVIRVYPKAKLFEGGEQE